MFGFIVFGFKIIYAAILGGALNYIPGEEVDRHKILETSLICIFGTAVLSLTSQISVNEINSTMGIGILSVTMGIIFISKNKGFIDRIIWYFAGISGMIIGSGYVFQASALIVLIYIILRNSERLINYIDREHNQSDDNAVENITN